MVKVEVCINTDSKQSVSKSVSAAYDGGASTIEVCSAMDCDGLTPKKEHIVEARKSFHDKAGLMVMIRPRNGDFVHSRQELQEMLQQIKMAAEAGADGIVLGVLREYDRCIAVESLHELMELSSKYGLKVTFHRAFDAIPDPLEALELLIDSGVDRILTSGTAWGQKKTALDGIKQLVRIIEKANGRIEVVIGGGINRSNVVTILNVLPLKANKISVHAYSGVQENGITTINGVKSLVNAVHNISPYTRR